MAPRVVLFVQNQIAARAWKAAKVLSERGVLVDAFETGGPNPTVDYSVFRQRFSAGVSKDLRRVLLGRRRILRALADTMLRSRPDIVHTFNAPDHLAAWLVGRTPVPLVHDVADAQTLVPVAWGGRLRRRLVRRLYARWEAKACRGADVLVTVTAELARYLGTRYGRGDVRVIENLPVAQAITPRPKLSAKVGGVHVVYAGMVSSRPGSHRTLVPVLAELAGGPVHAHLYGVTFDPREANDIKRQCAEAKQVHYHEPVAAHRLIEELTQYDWGVLFYPVLTDNIRMASPNKLYEYLLAGLPVVTNHEGRPADWVREHGMGYAVRTPAEARTRIMEGRAPKVQPRDVFLRADSILAAYAEALGATGGAPG